MRYVGMLLAAIGSLFMSPDSATDTPTAARPAASTVAAAPASQVVGLAKVRDFEQLPRGMMPREAALPPAPTDGRILCVVNATDGIPCPSPIGRRSVVFAVFRRA